MFCQNCNNDKCDNILPLSQNELKVYIHCLFNNHTDGFLWHVLALCPHQPNWYWGILLSWGWGVQLQQDWTALRS